MLFVHQLLWVKAHSKVWPQTCATTCPQRGRWRCPAMGWSLWCLLWSSSRSEQGHRPSPAERSHQPTAVVFDKFTLRKSTAKGTSEQTRGGVALGKARRQTRHLLLILPLLSSQNNYNLFASINCQKNGNADMTHSYFISPGVLWGWPDFSDDLGVSPEQRWERNQTLCQTPV